MNDGRNTVIFLAIAFFGSWLLAGAFAAFGGEWGSPASMGIGVVYMWIPGIAAIFWQKYASGGHIRKNLALYFKPNRWFFIAWIIPLLVALAAAEIGYELPWHEYSPGMEGFIERIAKFRPEAAEQIRLHADRMPFPFFWLILVQGMIGGLTVNAVVALGEEMSWRGFLQRSFSGMGFWTGSVLTGVIWGVWHAPIILMGHNYPDHPQWGVGMMVIFCVLASPLLSYVRLKAKSVAAAAIFHGTINATAGIPLVYLSGGSDLTGGITGLAGLIALALANIVLFVWEHMMSDTPFAFAEPASSAAPAGCTPETKGTGRENSNRET